MRKPSICLTLSIQVGALLKQQRENMQDYIITTAEGQTLQRTNEAFVYIFLRVGTLHDSFQVLLFNTTITSFHYEHKGSICYLFSSHHFVLFLPNIKIIFCPQEPVQKHLEM